jgi:hypothetical protein
VATYLFLLDSIDQSDSEVTDAQHHSHMPVGALGRGRWKGAGAHRPGAQRIALLCGALRYSASSVTDQSQMFQKIVGASVDGSIPETRSLTAVTCGNWKIVTP